MIISETKSGFSVTTQASIHVKEEDPVQHDSVASVGSDF